MRIIVEPDGSDYCAYEEGGDCFSFGATTEEALENLNEKPNVNPVIRNETKSVLSELEKELRKQFPDGAPEFISLALDEMDLYSKKNHDYADNEKPFGNFERVSNILSLYPGLDLSDPIVVCMTYMEKQLDAVLDILAKKKQTKVEGLGSRLVDVSVYAKIARIMAEGREHGKV